MENTKPRFKLWLEQDDGRVVMSDYRVRLLELIAATDSLAKAAAEMGLSYRRAWGKVRELEENLGYALVHSSVGGAGGGHTVVTEDGLALLAAYRRFQGRVANELDRAFNEELAPLAAQAQRTNDTPTMNAITAVPTPATSKRSRRT